MSKKWDSWAPMPLRLMWGISFIYHGYPKLSSGGHEQFVGFLQSVNVPAAGIMAWLVALLEVVGGLALILGAFVTIASVLFFIEMLVALFKVHIGHGFNFMNITGMTDAGPTFGMPGAEINLLFIAGLLTLMVGGAGALSIDSVRARKGGRGGRAAGAEKTA